MIDKTKIIDTVLERLTNLPCGHCLDLRTYKRNRSVLIVKESECDLLILENGYFTQTHQLKVHKFRKFLKTLLKIEFPRSNKIRLYSMGEYREEEASEVQRKII